MNSYDDDEVKEFETIPIMNGTLSILVQVLIQ